MTRIERTGKNAQTIILTLDEAIDLIAELGKAISLRKVRASNRKIHREMSIFAQKRDKDHFQVMSFSNNTPERRVYIDLLDKDADNNGT